MEMTISGLGWQMAEKQKSSGVARISEFLSKFKAEISRRRQAPKNNLFALAPWYHHGLTFLGFIVANLHGNALSTGIFRGDYMIVHILVRDMGAGKTTHRKAGDAGRSSVAKNFGACAGAKCSGLDRCGKTYSARLRGPLSSLCWRRGNGGNEPKDNSYATDHKPTIPNVGISSYLALQGRKQGHDKAKFCARNVTW